MTLNKDLHIAISGKSGCGNTTVSGLLAEKLGIKLINYTFRQLAAEKGMTLAEVIEAAKNDDSYDKYVDSHQVELAQAEPSVLGRMSTSAESGRISVISLPSGRL